MEAAAPTFAPVSDAIRARLADIYARCVAEIGATGVVCNLSGNCCNFDTYPHMLFASTLELQNLLATRPVGETAFSGKLCPYWVERKCTAREERPLGCRVFFCDKSYQAEHSQRIYEKYHREIEALCREAGVAYAYVPMVAALKHGVKTGEFFDPANPMGLLREALG